MNEPRLSEEEKRELLEMGMDLEQRLASPWQPRCVAAAFTRPASGFIFTMQTWIELDKTRSPLLDERTPGTLDELRSALVAFRYQGPNDITEEEAETLGELMLAEVRAGFDMALPMSPQTERGGARQEETGDDGFGSFLPLVAALVSQLGMSLDEALRLPVGQMYALLAAMRRNQGWRVEGATRYALRDPQGAVEDTSTEAKEAGRE